MINDDDPENSQRNDWDEMSYLWQEHDISVPKDLPKTIRRKTLQMYLIFGFEALTGLIALVVGFWALFYKEDDFSHFVGAFVIVASVLKVVISWRIRRRIWQDQSLSPIDQVELSIKRAKASINYANFNLIGVFIMLLVFGVFYLIAPDMFGDKYEKSGSKLLIGFAITMVFMLSGTVGSIIYKVKKKKDLGFFRELLNHLKGD